MNTYFKQISLLTLLSLALLFITNLVLVNLPLTELVGYEFSAINGILVSILGGIIFIRNCSPDDNYFENFRQSLTLTSLVLFIPFLIGFINQLFLEICPFSTDLFFYLLITIPSYFIGTFLAYWSIHISVKWKYLVFLIVYLLFILVPVAEIYFFPQVYFYNPLIGFFPGNIYDENISISLNLVLYRVISFGVLSTFVFSTSFIKGKKQRKNWLILVSPVFIYLFFVFMKPSMGYSTNQSRMEEFLPVKIETQHFVLYLSEDIVADKIKNIALQHEFHFQDLSEKYGFKIQTKIKSYIFGSPSIKKNAFGAENADVSKPWMGSIFIDADNYFSTLRHELAHVFAAEFGATPFKVAAGFNPSLIEGFAMALEDNSGDYPIHYLAWLAAEAGYKIPLKNLFSGFNFFTQASSFSYIVSGSFIKFLIDTRGFEKIRQLYRDNEFENIYGTNITKLETEYYNYLDAQKFVMNKSLAQLYFGRQPLIKKKCPRYTARLLARASDEFSKNNFITATETYKDAFFYSQSYNALLGYSMSLVKLDSLKNAIDLLKSEKINYDSTSYVYNLLIRLGDYYTESKDYQNARNIYQELREITNLDIFRNILTVRLDLAEKDSSLLYRYVTGSDYDRYELVNQLIKSELKPEYIGVAITLSTALKENSKLFAEIFVNSTEFGDSRYSLALLNLAKYCISNNELSFAKDYLSKIILMDSDSEFTTIVKQYESLTDWMILNNNILLNIEYKRI